MVSVAEKVENQVRKRQSYQRFLALFELMCQGKYFEALFWMHQEFDYYHGYKYRHTYIHATESLVVLGEDYRMLGDKVFEKKIEIEYKATENKDGYHHKVISRGTKPFSWSYHVEMLNRIEAWSVQRRKSKTRYGVTTRIGNMGAISKVMPEWVTTRVNEVNKNGDENKPEGVERALGKEPENTPK